jgi:hypothetical protein
MRPQHTRSIKNFELFKPKDKAVGNGNGKQTTAETILLFLNFHNRQANNRKFIIAAIVGYMSVSIFWGSENAAFYKPTCKVGFSFR